MQGRAYTDENRDFLGQVWQGVSRYSWEGIQNWLGYNISQTLNTTGNIDDVGYFGGATLLRGDIPMTYGVSYGSYILGDDLAFDPFETNPKTGRLTSGARLLRHEYGHTFQSQVGGPLYLFKYGIPSASTQGWTEDDAEYRSDQYFLNHYGASPVFSSYPKGYSPVNPRWWEYGLIPILPISSIFISLWNL